MAHEKTYVVCENMCMEEAYTRNQIDEKLSKLKYGIVGITRSIRSNDHYLYYSNDGINFFQVGEKLSKLTQDSSALFKIKDKYYYLGNNTYQISNDLINWSDEYSILNNHLSRVWGCSLFYDEINNIVYIYSAYQYEQDSKVFINDCGFESHYFKIIYQTATINKDGTLNIDQTIHNLLYTDNESYIDPYIIHDSVHGYVMSVKNEKTCKISIYKMTNPYNVQSNVLTLRMKGIEAGQLLTDNKGNIILYCQDYSVIHGPWNKNSEIDLQTYCRVKISNKNEISSENVTLLEPTKEIETFRHAGLKYCDKKDLLLIESIGIFPNELNMTNDINLGDGFRYYPISDGLTLINYPGVVYVFGGGTSNQTNITIKNYFKNIPLKFVITNTKVHYKEDSDIQPAAKDKIYTYNSTEKGVENITHTLYGRATSASYGFMVPYDRS